VEARLNTFADSSTPELYLIAKRDIPIHEELSELLDFMDSVLMMPELKEGFVLVYDVQQLGRLQMDLISAIATWSWETGRRHTWKQRCLRWQILACEGSTFVSAELTLRGWFLIYGDTTCDIYLQTDRQITENTRVVKFEPPEGEQRLMYQIVQIPGNYMRIMAKLMYELFLISMIQSSEEKHQAYWMVSGPVSAAYTAAETLVHQFWQPDVDGVLAGPESDEAPASSKAADETAFASKEPERAWRPMMLMRSKESASALPPAELDIGCAVLTSGFHEDLKLGWIKLVANGTPVEPESTKELQAFMDVFIDSDYGRAGFEIIYDIRNLRVPGVSSMMMMAEWGSDPVRQDKWEKLNKICKVVAPGGMLFSLFKSALTSWFYLCPPVCETYLMTDPDDLESASIFTPPVKPDLANKTDSNEARQEEASSTAVPPGEGLECSDASTPEQVDEEEKEEEPDLYSDDVLNYMYQHEFAVS